METKTYISLMENYIKDYHNLVYKEYPSFHNVMYVEYYSLDISNSNYDENLVNFHKDTNDENYGGRFQLILNFPILTSTNAPLSNNSSEKGIEIKSSSELVFVIDPKVDLYVKPEDIIKFHITPDYYGFYKVTNVEDSATFGKSYKKLNARLIPGLNQDKMMKFVCHESVFVQEYHRIFDREMAMLILNTLHKSDEYIKYINSRYKSNLDFHVFENDITIITSYERALKDLYMLRKNIHMEKLNLSYSFNNKFYSDEPNTIFDILINPYMNKLDFYKRLVECYEFNSLREKPMLKKHKYLVADSSADELSYHNYTYNSDYICSANLVSDMEIHDFWRMFEAFINTLKYKDTSTFYSDEIFNDSEIYKIMDGWIKILVTREFLINKKDCTIKYFNSFEKPSLFISTILLSQMLYINEYIIRFVDKFHRMPSENDEYLLTNIKNEIGGIFDDESPNILNSGGIFGDNENQVVSGGKI